MEDAATAAHEETVNSRIVQVLRDRRTIIAAGAFVCYLLFGFFALPALLTWQLQEQAAERLGHPLQVGRLQFNPLSLRLEAQDAKLSDPKGRELLGLRRLVVDFELRSLVDLAWNFSQVSVDGLSVDVEIGPDGASNLDSLLARLAAREPAQPGPPTRLIVQRTELTDGRVRLVDRLLAEPLVAQLEPIAMRIDGLSTMEGARAPYVLSARTARGETLESSGELGLQPFNAGGRFSLAGLEVATLARASSRWLALESPSGRADLSASFKVASSGQTQADASLDATLEAVELGVRGLSFAAGAAPAELLALDEIRLTGGTVDLRSREAHAESLDLRRGRAVAAIDAEGRLDWSALLRPTSPAEASASHDTDASGNAGAWKVGIARVAIAELAVSFSDARSATQAQVDALTLMLAPRAELGGDALRVTLEEPAIALDTLKVRSGEVEARSAAVEIGAQRLAFEPKGDSAELSVDALRLKLAESAFTPEAAREFAKAKRVAASAQGLRYASGSDGPELVVDGLSASLGDVALRGAGDDGDILRISAAEATGATLRLRERSVRLQRLALAGVDLKAWIDAGGALNWERALGVGGEQRQAAGGAPAAPASGRSEPAARPWRIVLDESAVEGSSASFEDRRSAPPLGLALESVRARVTGFDSAADKAVQVDVAARVTSGGEIVAKGSVRPDGSEAALDVKVADVGLVPSQPLLARIARLRLEKGRASLDGRLRYGAKSAEGPQLAYRGAVAVRELQVVEAESGRDFIGWDSVSSDDVSLSIGPDRLDVGELRIDAVKGRLMIGQDGRLRLVDLLRKEPSVEAGKTASAGNAASAGKAQGGGTSTAAAAAEGGVHEKRRGSEAAEGALFPVSIARTRVERSVVEFADLSLRPQFGARMHELQGVVTGLGTDPQRTAKLQLAARVNEYGSAKISGELNLVEPDAFTDVEMVFSNLEISSLSPYSVRFAGYRVAGGKLSVDLQYKIKDRKLHGEHKVVIEKMKLGDKVESPEALDLPLELAIALLQDSKGVIDLGVPVSGDLDNPQFSLRGIVLKAFGNVITGIVTAPFRALGALLGGASEAVDAIEFEPGSAVLAPPERGKLASVAKVLAQRPELKLVVAGVQSPQLDAPALKSLALRSEVAALGGAKLAAGEDPGPLDVSEPRTRRAVEQVFAKRYSPAVLDALRSRAARPATAGAAAQPPAGEKPGGGDTTRSDEPAGRQAARSDTADEAFHRSLVDKLLEEQPLPQDALAQLASRRADSVVRELTTTAGAPADRVSTASSRETSADAAKTVSLKLELAVAK